MNKNTEKIVFGGNNDSILMRIKADELNQKIYEQERNLEELRNKYDAVQSKILAEMQKRREEEERKEQASRVWKPVSVKPADGQVCELKVSKLEDDDEVFTAKYIAEFDAFMTLSDIYSAYICKIFHAVLWREIKQDSTIPNSCRW